MLAALQWAFFTNWTAREHREPVHGWKNISAGRHETRDRRHNHDGLSGRGPVGKNRGAGFLQDELT
jgi:hypothetical protein